MMKWDWYFPGAVTLNSNQKNPVMRYMIPGKYDVALSVINANGTFISNKIAYVTVTAPYTLPYSEGFENGLNLEARNRWGGYSWQITSSAAYSGSSSILLRKAGYQMNSRWPSIIPHPVCRR